jgi:hypothetical protein
MEEEVTFFARLRERFAAMIRVLLGLFIVVQLVFIVASNVGSIALYLSGSGNSAAAQIWQTINGAFTEPWAHLTGQEQYWRMFAPSVPPRAMFIRLRTHRDGQTDDIASEFEPLPGEAQLHWPGPGERLWHVEKTLTAPFAIYDPDEIASRPDEWRDYLLGAIRNRRDLYLASMAWKVRRDMDAKGETHWPDQVDLIVSIHTLSAYERLGRPEFAELTLRWRPYGDLDFGTPMPEGRRWEPLAP